MTDYSSNEMMTIAAARACPTMMFASLALARHRRRAIWRG